MASPEPLFIRVKYGNDETLICNPGCAIVNLLTMIKNRTGHVAKSITIDLTDDSGLIQELDAHRQDYASDYLSSTGTYILVRKQKLRHRLDDGDGVDSSINDEKEFFNDSENGQWNSDGNLTSQYGYVPLLNNWRTLFPEYHLRSQTAAGVNGGAASSVVSTGVSRRKMVPRNNRIKSTSPAGAKPTAMSHKKPAVAKGNGNQTSQPPAGNKI